MFVCLSGISKGEGDFRTKMANIFILTVDIILHIFRFLRIEDRIAFALSCQRFRWLCMDEGVFRKLDLSRCVISTSQRGAVNSFFWDRQLTENIRELNVSNLRVLNWQMDDHLQKFIMSICPHLETLHVFDCRVSLQILHSILKEAPQLTSLSWSIWDFTSEDTEFFLKTMKSSEGICLKNIKHLHLHVNQSLPQIQIAKFLVLSYCRDLEELKIYTWWVDEQYYTGENFPLASDQSILGFCQSSVQNELNNLHSLVVLPMVDYVCFNKTYRSKLCGFVDSVLSRKSSSTAWKNFCILPEIHNSREDSSLFDQVRSDDFHSVEDITADLRWSPDAVDELKTLFGRIGDNTVRRLQLCLPNNSDSTAELCNLISRVGGHSLKFLHISFYLYEICDEQNILIHSLFSNCLNITELDLLDFCFERDICEPLSELKHLIKVHLQHCAISSRYDYEDEVEISRANLLTFVENCKNITHLHVRGCDVHGIYISCHLTDDDLLAFAMLRNLESVTLCSVSGIRDWTFLKHISEHCKFLTTLRIQDWNHFNSSHIPILMESSTFLKHLAIHGQEPIFASEVFWNLLSHAKNLERLCIGTLRKEISINIPLVAVETLKSLPRLHVLHLHSYIQNVDFYDHLIRILEEKESDCKLSFNIVTSNGMNTWINHPTGYSLISDKTLPLNFVELCHMTPILNVPRF